MIALLLDLANIVGGFLLAVPLLRELPRVGPDAIRVDRAVHPFAWLVGVIALAAGGYYLILHLTSGPHIFHFELIGIAVGLVLLWDRLTGRPQPTSTGSRVEGTALLLAILGLIAIIVGVQGLFTPN